MKHLITMTLSSLTLISFVGCSGQSAAPSQNSALNSVSHSSGKAKPGMMQTTMDRWLKEEWTPTVNADKKIQNTYLKVQTTDDTGKKAVKYVEAPVATTTAKDTKEPTYIQVERTTQDGKKEVKYVENDEKNFTLQEYVDKAIAYQKAKPNDYEHSNVKKLESMPVIGK